MLLFINLELIRDYIGRHLSQRLAVSGGRFGAGRIFVALLELVNVYSYLALCPQFFP